MTSAYPGVRRRDEAHEEQAEAVAVQAIEEPVTICDRADVAAVTQVSSVDAVGRAGREPKAALEQSRSCRIPATSGRFRVFVADPRQPRLPLADLR